MNAELKHECKEVVTLCDLPQILLCVSHEEAVLVANFELIFEPDDMEHLNVMARVKLEDSAQLFQVTGRDCFLKTCKGEMVKLDLSIVRQIEEDFLNNLPIVDLKPIKMTKMPELAVITEDTQFVFAGNRVRLGLLPVDESIVVSATLKNYK